MSGREQGAKHGTGSAIDDYLIMLRQRRLIKGYQP